MEWIAIWTLILGALIARVPPGDGFRKAVLLGIAFSANLGGLATPVSSPPNAIVMRYLDAHGLPKSGCVWPRLGALDVVRAPMQIAGVECARNPTPERGQHTDAVLAEFGFSAEEIAALRRKGVV